VIVEIQRKNVDLEARLQAMDPSVTLTSASSLTNSLITKWVALHQSISGRMGGPISYWMDGSMDGWMDGWMDW